VAAVSYEGYASSLPRMQVGSGCLFQNGSGQILLVKPVYKPLWEIPGGAAEQGESPMAACRREIAEELGLDLHPGRLLVVDYREPQPGLRGDALRFVFDGGVLSPQQISAIRLQPEELSEFRFVDPADLDEYVIPVMARRLRACLNGGGYLEEGSRTGIASL
jgi:8-oxo-dGTP pyrophosphatase MutT (NUDIX family)